MMQSQLIARAPLRSDSLLSEETEEADLVVRALLSSHVLVNAAIVAVVRELLLLAALLVLLSDDFGCELKDLGLSRLELAASLCAAFIEVGELFEIPASEYKVSSELGGFR